MTKDNEHMQMNSRYLLTLLFRTSFFKRMKNWEILAFLIPYVDGFGNPFPTSSEGIREKMKMLKDGTLGGQIQNIASQGFSFSSLHAPSITFPYYYEQLGNLADYLKAEYDKYEKAPGDASWNTWNLLDSDIENELLKQSLWEILMLPRICFSRKHEVYSRDKYILMKHLNQYGNQYVLAELLYYITSANHELPNVDIQIRNTMEKKLSRKIIAAPNVACKLRLNFDETIEEMKVKLEGVKQLRILCLSGSSFLSENGLNFFSILKNRISDEKPLNVQVIFQASDSNSAIEAAKNRMAPNCLNFPKMECISDGIRGFFKLKELAPDNCFGKSTNIQITYSLCFYYFYENFLDYVKVDILSPLISSDDNRPSLIAFRRLNEDLFKHFEETFMKIWNNEEESNFLE